MNLRTKKAVIFDLDGTLYDLHRMRLRMGCKLLAYCFCHPNRVKDPFLVARFRKMREREEYASRDVKYLCELLDQSRSLTAGTSYRVVTYWMFEAALSVVKKEAYSEVLLFIRNFQRDGGRVYIYSDYPAEDKLRALGITPTGVFVSGSVSELAAQKPSEESMNYILSSIGLPRDSIFYVGDREDKDRISAEYAEIDYMDIQIFREYIAVCSVGV